MSWIKMNTGLDWHPKVVIISSSFDDDRLKVVGALHAVWSVFDTFTEDGTLLGYSPAMLDQKIGLKGFSRAMIEVGWLIENEGKSLSIKDFEEHNGKSAKRRSQNAGAKKRSRDADKTLTHVSKVSSPDDDELLTREDKRRVYNPIVPKGTNSDPVLDRARMLFRMRSSTPLDASQQRAWQKNKGAVSATSENDWLLIEWFYAQGTGKGEAGEYRRRDLATLLGHWNGEIQKAAEEAKNRGADFLQKRKAAEQAEGPTGWRKALVEIFDDTTEETAAAAIWGKLPQSVRDSITLRLEGGAA